MKSKLHFLGEGEVEAFLGLFFDGFSKIIGAIGILKYGFKMPNEILFSRILPGIAIATIFGNLAYFLEAQLLGKKENRVDVTAQPYGIGAGQIFSWIFLIIGPIYLKTGNAILAWQVSLAAGFIGGGVEIIGSFFGKIVLKNIPKPALMGNLAGAATVWLSLLGMFQCFSKNNISFLPLFIGLMLFFGKYKFSKKISPGVCCIIIGIISIYVSKSYNYKLIESSFTDISIYLPKFSLQDILIGLKHVKDYLPVIIPLQITNFLTTLQGIESAAEAGDNYPVKTSMFLDGIGTIMGTLFGNPFPTTVFYGHPIWKKLGARSGYVLFNSLAYFLIGFTGIGGVIAEIIPFEIIVPILIFLGLSVSSQSFESYNKKYFPATIMAFIPIIAQYISIAIESTLRVANSNLNLIDLLGIENMSFPFKGIIFLSNGAFLLSIYYSSLIVAFIDMNLKKIGVIYLILFLSSITGLIHSPAVEFLNKNTLYISFGYAFLSGIFLFISFVQIEILKFKKFYKKGEDDEKNFNFYRKRT